MKQLIQKFIRDEAGASAVEYGLLVALIAVAIITAVSTLGTNLSSQFDNVAGQIGSS
jgi:pilus assembly protein Flp/PilA